MKSKFIKFYTVIILIAMLFITIPCIAEVYQISLKLKNGKEINYDIDHNPIIRFEDGYFVMNLDSCISITHDINDIQKFFYKTQNNNLVESISENLTDRISFVNGRLLFKPERDGSLYIYDMVGHEILSRQAYKGEFIEISSEYFSNGVYIVKFDNLLLKIIRR